MKFSSKWAAAFVAPAVVAGGSLVMALPAAAVDLPDVTPKELLMLMEGDVTGFSGTVTKTSDIGLPVMELSSMMSQDAVDDMAEKMPEGFEDFVPQLIEQNSITQLVAHTLIRDPQLFLVLDPEHDPALIGLMEQSFFGSF